MSLTPASMVALFGAMALLAALPSTSVLAVSSRAASHGFRHGALVAAGVVVGDAIFIVVAIFGLALLMDAMAGLGPAVRALGGLYLIWLGLRLWHARPAEGALDETEGGHGASFMTGLLITLGDQKAILFYLGFFPAFVDLARMTWIDAMLLIAIAAIAVGGVKLIYAAAADQAGRWIGSGVARALNLLAACVMIGIGLFLLSSLFSPR